MSGNWSPKIAERTDEYVFGYSLKLIPIRIGERTPCNQDSNIGTRRDLITSRMERSNDSCEEIAEDNGVKCC